MDFKRERTEDRVAERAEDVDGWLTTEPGERLAGSKDEAHKTDQIEIPLRHHGASHIFAFLPQCQRPPWGYLSAVDLTTHKLVWSHPLGTARDSGPFGDSDHAANRGWHTEHGWSAYHAWRAHVHCRCSGQLSARVRLEYRQAALAGPTPGRWQCHADDLYIARGPSACRHHRRRKLYLPNETRRLRNRLRAAGVTAELHVGDGEPKSPESSGDGLRARNNFAAKQF